MSKIDFTDEERALVLSMASTRSSKLERILGHMTWQAPGIAFILYGLFSEQMHALAIGALSLVAYQAWGLHQELKYSELYGEIFRKVARLIDSQASEKQPERD